MTESGITVKWKIFRIINYLQVLAGAGLVISIVARTSSYSFNSLENMFYFFLTTLSFSVFAANGLSNLYLIERFLPDQLPPRATLRANMVFYILQIILSALLIILTVAAFFDYFDQASRDDAFPVILLSALATLCLTSVPLWFMQAQLRSTLKRNHYNRFDQFLEENEDL